MRCGHPGCRFGIVLSLSRWRHVDTHGAKIDHDAVPSTAADQPTTEPSAVNRVADLLIEHSRYRIEDCYCGWADLGKSHAAHVAQALADAGLLAPAPQPAAEQREVVVMLNQLADDLDDMRGLDETGQPYRVGTSIVSRVQAIARRAAAAAPAGPRPRCSGACGETRST